MKLAIMDLQPRNVSPSIAQTVSDLIRTELFNSGLFRVIERAEMDEILKEQQFQQSGCTETACAVQIGKLLSANKIMVGTVGKLGEKFVISARIVDVERGEMEFAETAEAISEEGLSTAVKEFAGKISGRIMGTIKSGVRIEKGEKARTAPLEQGDIYGEIVKVKGNEAVVNMGSELGLRPKQQFLVLLPVEEVYTSQITGIKTMKVMGYAEIGKIKIKYVESDMAKGTLDRYIQDKDFTGKKLQFLGTIIDEIGFHFSGSSQIGQDTASISRENEDGSTYKVYFKTGQQEQGGNWEFGVGYSKYSFNQRERSSYFSTNKNINNGISETIDYYRISKYSFKYYFLSLAYDYKPFKGIWSSLYLGLSLNAGYDQYTITAGSTSRISGTFQEEWGTPKQLRSLAAGGYAFIGLYIPPIPSFPILLHIQFEAGYLTLEKVGFHYETGGGISFRW